ncbi:hypothetical protein IW261DRAFT_1470158 [Armillaria novae-zelandiae]|uniref:Protein kinase domain-containing protein n=1 Tax=Armillaria novae-zelandiae TaxID=153914 RepID=A0AA39PCX9_9AGAR|nr:hypothetical protein IW261DRAFT_1470158 [Armillaria novae-zelandiae]
MSTLEAVPNLESTYFSGVSLELDPLHPPDCPVDELGNYEKNAFRMSEATDRLDASIARSVPTPASPPNVTIVLDKRLLCSTWRIAHVWTAHVHNTSPNDTYPMTMVAKIYDPVYFGEAEFHDPFAVRDLFVSRETQAYDRLQSLYGTKVPRFYGHFVAPLPSQRNRTVNVILLEYIRGRDIRDVTPTEEAGALCPTHKDTLIDAVIRLFYDVLALGVAQRDMQPRNVILRARRKDGPFCSTQGCPLRYEADSEDMQMVMVDFEEVEFPEPDSKNSDPVAQATYVDDGRSYYHEYWLRNLT